MLAPMNALRLAGAAVAASALLAAALGACGPNTAEFWQCLDPVTGKIDSNAPYDDLNYIDAGVYDPCHCFDPGGEAPQCPYLIDAGQIVH